jgi:cytochrome d ubiquinol oxidase subunit II
MVRLRTRTRRRLERTTQEIELMDLNTIWFVLIGVLIAGYAVLDGFDLGVGTLHLFARDEEERRVHMAAIGPVWDGNEVWLITGGGALFAAFPVVYATVFSGFYLALMLLLVGLILRAVSLEFRHSVDGPRWRRVWDWSFGIGSLVPSLLFGVAVGNILRGIPLSAEGDFAGTFLGLLNPYALCIGLVSLALFTLHGALYLRLKSEGALAARMERWIPRLWTAFLVIYAVATVATRFVSPFLFEGVFSNPIYWVLVVLLGAGLSGIRLASRAGLAGWAFISSAVTILAMIGVAAVGLFPRLVPTLGDLGRSLTIYNAASTPKTQTVMLVIALIGMPFVIGYTAVIYWIFRGKVKVSSSASGYGPEAAAKPGAATH